MLNTNRAKGILLAVLAAVLACCLGYLRHQEQRVCMGVPVVSGDFLEPLREAPEQVGISWLELDGKRLASGDGLAAIYLSQPEESCQRFSRLRGTLGVPDPEVRLYFLDDPAIRDIEGSLRGGTPLSLVAVDGQCFRRISVVLTTLPVMYLEQDAETPVFLDQKEREVTTGSYLLSGRAGTQDAFRTTSGTTQWRLRGDSSFYYAKPPYKLSLKDGNGEKADDDLLGLGAEDDWILNPMYQDDTKVREITAIQLWNRYLVSEAAPDPMSAAEYLELIVNGEYQGLYLLQRRVDRKYLKLDKDRDILLKGGSNWEADTLAEGYEIVSSPLSWEESYQALDDVLSFRGENRIDRASFEETSLYLDFLAAMDNVGYKNMFYVLRRERDYYVMTFVPWDTDMSLGISWEDGDFVYDFDGTVECSLNRMEYLRMGEQYPSLGQTLSDRWKERREGAYRWETVRETVQANIGRICRSGAYERDIEAWGLLYGGEDNHGELLRWCEARLSFLDQVYE